MAFNPNNARYIPGMGDTNAKVMYVGEAPGYEENLQGEPFLGLAGHELTRMIQEGGMLRSEGFLTNVLRFHPPGNYLAHFIRRMYKTDAKNKPSFAQGFTPFQGDLVLPFVQSHLTDLKNEIAAVRPNVIVALGNTPLKYLTGESGVKSWRGSVLSTNFEIEGRPYKVIPTYHPTAILKQWPCRWDLVQDLRRVKKEAEFPTVKDIPWNHTVRPSLQAVVYRLQRLLDLAENEPGGIDITCDIETRFQQVACVGIGWSKHDAICIPFMCAGRGNYWSSSEEKVVLKYLKLVLEHPNIDVKNQNYLYDAFYLALWFGIWSIPTFDTMLAQNVLQPGKEKALGYLASIHCAQYRYWKDDGKNWSDKMDETVLWRYNCMDCGYTYEVANSLEHALRAYGTWDQFLFQMSLFEPVLKMMLRGVGTDRTTRLEMSSELGMAIKERELWLAKMFGHPVNPRSPKQLAALFYTDFKLPVIKNRKTGNPTCDDDALDKIKMRDPLFAKPCTYIQQIRTLGVLKSTFVDAEGPKNRLYTSFNIAGTKTTRFSSSSNPIGWGTNAMNVPKHGDDEPFQSGLPDIRKLYKPDPGYTWVKIDLTKADLHVVVWESEEEELKDQLRAGKNIYKEACANGIISIPYAKAKIFLHGTDYGGGARTMAINCKIPVAVAAAAQAAWFAAHPGIKDWQERVKYELLHTRTISNKFGYKIFFFDRVESVLPEALAWCPQSTVARVINQGLVRIDNKFHPRDVRLMLQVHDELDMQVRTTKRDVLIPQILECCKVLVPYDDPLIIPADVEISERSWGEVQAWEGVKI